MWGWIKEKWEFCLGALAALVGGLLFLLRIQSNERAQKRVLENANDAHKKEVKAHREAEERLKSGLENIQDSLDKSKEEIEKNARSEQDKVNEEKKDFVKKQKNSDKLARDLADELGADFVDSSE